jgi:hypothetical protein
LGQSQFGSNFEFDYSLDDLRAVIRFLASEESADLFDLLLRVGSSSQIENIANLLKVDDADADKSCENVFDSLFEASVELRDLAFLMKIGNDLTELLYNSVSLENKVLVADGLDGQQSDFAGIK